MRKLSNVEKNIKTSLEGITNSCTCRAICRPGDDLNREFANDLQAEHAHTGTMPQGVKQDI